VPLGDLDATYCISKIDEASNLRALSVDPQWHTQRGLNDKSVDYSAKPSAAAEVASRSRISKHLHHRQYPPLLQLYGENWIASDDPLGRRAENVGKLALWDEGLLEREIKITSD
jgi:hypothetical protein